MKSYALLMMLFLVLSNERIIAQVNSASDSLLYDAAKNDTTLLRQIIQSRPGESISSKALVKIGTILYFAKKENKAEQEFKAVYKQFKGQMDAYTAGYYLGRIAFNKENYTAAKKYLSEYIAFGDNKKTIEFAKYFLIKSKYQNNDTDYVADYDVIYDTDHGTIHDTDYDDFISKLIIAIQGEKSRTELMELLGLNHIGNFRNNYLNPAMYAGLIEMTHPDSPKSKNQKYRLTSKGNELKVKTENKRNGF